MRAAISAGAVITAVIALGACSNLPPVEADTCGNGVIDPGEECDGSGGLGASAGTCGAPGSAAACHFTCVLGSAAQACPSNFTCGVDGECRKPSGLFTVVGQPQLFGADDLGAGDVDGDHIDDLIGTSQDLLTVRFGSPDGSLDDSDSQTIFAPNGTPQFGDINNDGLIDVVVPSQAGLFSFLAAGGTLAPFAYSAIDVKTQIAPPVTDSVRILAVNDPGVTFDPLDQALVGISDGVIAIVEPLATKGVCFDGSDAGTKITLRDGTCSTATPASSLVGHHVTHAQTGVDAAGSNQVSTGETVAIGSAGSDTVRLFTSTGNSVNAIMQLNKNAIDLSALGSGYTLTTGGGEILFGLFDNDDCVDLVVPVMHDGVPELAIAFGNSVVNVCVGTFAAAQHACPFGSATDPDCGSATSYVDPVPLAAVDLNGDGLTDLVLTTGVVLSASNLPNKWTLSQDVFVAFPRAWDDVAIADVNHDGTPDLIGIVHDEADVDVLLSTGLKLGGEPVYNAVELPTPLPVRHLEAADFDGDGTGDVAVAVGLTDTPGEQDHILVAYGTALGEPVPFIDMGTFTETISIAPASLVFGSLDLDTIADLVVVDLGSDGSGSATSRVAVLDGSTSRRMLAPFIAQESVGSGGIGLGGNGGNGNALCGSAAESLPVQPLGAAIGNFAQTSPDYLDVAMLSELPLSCPGEPTETFFGLTAVGVGGGDLSQSLGGNSSVAKLPGAAGCRAIRVLRRRVRHRASRPGRADHPRRDRRPAPRQRVRLRAHAWHRDTRGEQRLGVAAGHPCGARAGVTPFSSPCCRRRCRRCASTRCGSPTSTAPGCPTPCWSSCAARAPRRWRPRCSRRARPAPRTPAKGPLMTPDTGCRNAVPLRVTPTGPLELAMICPLGSGMDQQLELVDATTGAPQGEGFGIPATDELVVGDFNGDGLDDLALVLTTSRAVLVVRQCAIEEPCGAP